MIQGKDYIGVGTGAVIVNEKNEILLLARNKAPEKGRWAIPGGKVELFETLKDAIRREVREETGLTIDVVDELCVTDHILPDEHVHWVTTTFLCRILDGVAENREPTKHTALSWFALDRLPPNLALPTVRALEKLRARPTVETTRRRSA
jgi:mutator protein MutT